MFTRGFDRAIASTAQKLNCGFIGVIYGKKAET